MLDLSSLQYSSEYPNLLSIIITVLTSLVLGILVAFTYEKTSRDIRRPDHFLQTIILITIVAATIIQAIGDSVARGLGMIGALSIIRFRTTVQDPRNIVFIFSAIAAGIACGVFGILIAIVGTLGFSITAFLLYFSNFSNEDQYISSIKIEIDDLQTNKKILESTIKKYCIKHDLTKVQLNLKKGSNSTSYSYDMILGRNISKEKLIQEISLHPGTVICKFEMVKNNSNKI